jgi:hypothetical protein
MAPRPAHHQKNARLADVAGDAIPAVVGTAVVEHDVRTLEEPLVLRSLAASHLDRCLKRVRARPTTG